MNEFIDSKTIEKAVYNLCLRANYQYPADLHKKVYEKYLAAKDVESKQKLENILKNIDLSYKSRRPLCQDTGQVLVFVEIGANVSINEDLNKIINGAVARAYNENFYRKSVVKNALFERVNTGNNAPAIVYTDIVDGNEIKIDLLLKGAGSENYSSVKMFTPASTKEDIFEYVYNEISKAGEKACPPYVLGLGVGGTMDYACVLSKKAFFVEELNKEEKHFLSDLNEYLSEKGCFENILDIRLKTSSTHIASLPVALTINCHSTRHSQCLITPDTTIYRNEVFSVDDLCNENENLKEVFVSDLQTLKSLQVGENVLLSGEIYTARDAAHARLLEIFDKSGSLPFDINDKVIFYAGPCPASQNEPIGPIGPTTSARMDKFTEFVYGNGIIATIGKGERSVEAVNSIKRHKGKYFTVQGGIACLLSKCVIKAEIIAFDDLGTEAIRKLTVSKLPVKVEI